MDDLFAVGRLLEGLNPQLDGVGFLPSIGVPRSHAREAYLRILRSPYRDCGLLVEWRD